MSTTKQSKVGKTTPAPDPEATPEILLSLLDKDDATNRLLARHPRASAELLEKLSHSSDRAIRQAVASNPNTPPQTFVRLGQQFPKAFLANPALDLLLMVSPDLIEQAPQAFLIRLLKQADCPTSLLVWAAGHPQAKVQLAVAMNAKAPEQALEKLQASKHVSVLEVIRSRGGSCLVDDPEKAFEQAVRDRLGSLPFDDLVEAWKAGDIGLAQWSALPLAFRLTKACNDTLPAEAIAAILRNTSWTLEAVQDALPNSAWSAAVACVSDVPLSVLEAFARNAMSEVRRAVSENPSADLPMLGMLVRIAQNPSLPASLLEALAEAPEDLIRAGVAGNPSTPSRMLEGLANDLGYGVRHAVAENPSTPAHVLAALANDSGDGVRARVAGNPSTPVHVLEGLATDSAELVSRRVAGNPSTPAALLEVLAPEFGRGFWQEVADNPSAPAPVLELLAKNAVRKVRESVAAHPSTPLTALEALGNKDSESSIRIQVARNSATSVPLLAELAEDRLDLIRAAVASNSSTPTALLERLAKDRSKVVLTALIRNQNCPFPMLSGLAKAKDASVREAFAAAQAQHSDQCSRALWADANERVRHSLAGNQKLSPGLLDELAQSAELERDKAVLLRNKSLSASTAQSLADKLLTTEATASAWYRRQLSKATPEVAESATAGKTLRYFGKDTNKAALSKRPMAPVMALCSGPFVEPSRIVKLAGSTDWLVRAAVARNPGTPANLFRKLAGDVHPLVASLARVMQSAAAGTKSAISDSPNSVPDLHRASREVVARIRRSLETHRERQDLYRLMLDQVLGDQVGAGETFEALVTFTHLPFDRRYLAFRVFSRVMDRLDAEQVALVFEKGAESTNAEVRRVLASEPSCPVHVLKLLGSDDDPEVFRAVLSNAALPRAERLQVIQPLLNLRGRKLIAILRAKDAPSELLEDKSTSKDVEVRLAVASNPATPRHVLDVLSKDVHPYVREAAAESSLRMVEGNRATPALVQETSSKNRIPMEVLEALSKDPQEDIRLKVAGNTSTPATLLEVLSKDSSVWVREAVASNVVTPVPVLEALGRDTELQVRMSVVRNSAIPAQLLDGLSKDSDAVVRMSVAMHRLTSWEALNDLAKDQHWEVRRRASHSRSERARDADTPVSVLEALVVDSDADVRMAVARNAATPSPLLDVLAKDSDWRVRSDVAHNTLTPFPTLDALANDSVNSVRTAVAGNPSAPRPLLESLAGDEDIDVRRALAFNRSSPSEILDQYIQGWVTRLKRAIEREVCIRNGQLPQPQVPVLPGDLLRGLDWLGLVSAEADNKALTKASRSKDWLTRLGAALHPSATKGILELLSKDSDPDVARAAAMPRSEVSARNEQVGAI
jgi:hypothetical protein